MKPNADADDDYPFCLDMASLPPNHNRLIGAVPAITMDNALGALGLIQKLIDDSPRFELNLGEEETAGLYALVDNIREALRFEVYHRQRHGESPAAEPSAGEHPAESGDCNPPSRRASSG